MKHYKNLHLKLTDDSRNESNIGGIDTYDKLVHLERHVLEKSPNFPNTAIALSILLAYTDIWVSKLKIKKTFITEDGNCFIISI